MLLAVVCSRIQWMQTATTGNKYDPLDKREQSVLEDPLTLFGSSSWQKVCGAFLQFELQDKTFIRVLTRCPDER